MIDVVRRVRFSNRPCPLLVSDAVGLAGLDGRSSGGKSGRLRPGLVLVSKAGADGNVSAVPVPGGLSTMISGIGVFYPDKRPTQRVGIVPDLEITPTIEGIRLGRDEVLDAAIRLVQK